MARPIDRRLFLRLSAGAPLFSQTAAWAADGERSADVVVVGAGLAGMRAADMLRRAGRRVVVFEARPQAGGRVQTIRTPFDGGLYGEAGPIRIPTLHRRVIALAREHGLALVPFAPPGGAALVTANGTTVRSDAPMLPFDLRPDEQGLGVGKLLQRYLGQLPANLSSLDPSPADFAGWDAYDKVTWPDWLRSRGASPGAIAMMTVGGDSRGLSALYVLRQIALLKTNAPFDFKIKGGMDLLPRAMAAALGDIIRTGAAVVGLDEAPDHVRIDYVEADRRRSIRASRVILAVPFSTLRRIGIRPGFSPEKRRTIAELPYFPAVRFLLQSRSRFWNAEGYCGAARTDRAAEVWDPAYEVPGRRGLLAVNVGGEIGRSLEDKSNEACIAFGVGLAADSFPKIRLEFEKGVAYRWMQEPWSRGGFAVFNPGQMTSMMPGIARPEGRVHFAGEHTSSWMGWMEGALQSGERAAHEVMNIKREAL